MDFATTYFSRYKLLPSFYPEEPDHNLDIIVVIPCYDDVFIFKTLESLEKSIPIQSKIEIIVVVNSSERTPEKIISNNYRIYQVLLYRAKQYKNYKLMPIIVENTIRKKAGVGFARKTGMDEAVRHFAAINKPQGLIVSLDADTIVSKNYFKVIEYSYYLYTFNCFTFQFSHDFNPSKYSNEIIQACKKYEIYLRYFRLGLKLFNFPFAIHTIGSCFAVRAEAYTKLGGMSTKQGGEDFYFLQKAAKMQSVYEINDIIVHPSPRISERVPFGTGPSIQTIIKNGRFPVYNFKLFLILKSFYELFPFLKNEKEKSDIPLEISNFIGERKLDNLLWECRKYSSTNKTFIKRMFDRFDSFFIVKFLNSFDKNSAYPPIEIDNAAKDLLNFYEINLTKNIYEQILFLDLAQNTETVI